MSYRGGGDKKEEVIRFGTNNILNFRNVGLNSALHGMDQVNIELGLLQENNIVDGFYVRESAVFSVISSDVMSRHCRGVALF